MAAYAPNENTWTLEGMVHEMPNPISRWDSHQSAPGHTDAVKPAFVATHSSHVNRQKLMQRRMSDRKQLLAPQKRTVDNSSTSPMTITMADDNDSADEEIISRGVVAYGQDSEPLEMHVTQAGMPFLTGHTGPSHHLLLGANGEDVQEIGQWYFACQLPEKSNGGFCS